jgi:hypothetical protein
MVRNSGLCGFNDFTNGLEILFPPPIGCNNRLTFYLLNIIMDNAKFEIIIIIKLFQA